MAEPVGKTADPAQVKKAGEREKEAQRLAEKDLLDVMASASGRRFIWRLLGKCKMFETPYHPSGSTLYHNVGRGDIGRELMAEILDTTIDGYLLMQKEAYEAIKRAQESHA